MTNKEDGEALAFHLNTFLLDFLAGGISSAVAETIVAPLERVKLILQVQSCSRHIKKEDHYKGLMDALRRIPQEQGILSLWRGNTISIIRCFPTKALKFAIKDKLEYFMLRDIDPREEYWKFAAGNFAAGGIAGGLTLAIVYPLDIGRTRLATDVGAELKVKKKKQKKNGKQLKDREFKGYIDFIRKTTATHGFRGLYSGFGISFIGISLYRAIYFGFYDTGKGIYFDSREDTPFYQKWILAQTSVALAGLVTFPIDSIRRRMMMQVGEKAEERKYKSAKDCFLKSIEEEGLRGLFRGALTNILRSTGGALVLVLYDEIKPIFQGNLSIY